MQNTSQNSKQFNFEIQTSPQEKKNWVSPEINDWSSSYLEGQEGPGSDAGSRTYLVLP